MAGSKTRGDLALNEADHFRNADLPLPICRSEPGKVGTPVGSAFPLSEQRQILTHASVWRML
jgi:hypothetical protein